MLGERLLPDSRAPSATIVLKAGRCSESFGTASNALSTAAKSVGELVCAASGTTVGAAVVGAGETFGEGEMTFRLGG